MIIIRDGEIIDVWFTPNEWGELRRWGSIIMARTDNLFVRTALSPEEIAKLFVSYIGYTVEIKEEVYNGNILRHVHVPEFAAYFEALKEGYRGGLLAIRPTVLLRIHPNLEMEWDEPKTALIQATLGMIQANHFDVVLELMDASIVALIYKDRQLTLNAQGNIWTPERLKIVKIPYQLIDIPAP